MFAEAISPAPLTTCAEPHAPLIERMPEGQRRCHAVGSPRDVAPGVVSIARLWRDREEITQVVADALHRMLFHFAHEQALRIPGNESDVHGLDPFLRAAWQALASHDIRKVGSLVA